MRRFLSLAILFSFQAPADVCQIDVFAKKCFEIDQPADLSLLYNDPVDFKENYCKTQCQPDMTSFVALSPEDIKRIKEEQASFVMNEVQKGMTEVMMDLMKVRSGFALQGSADSAIKSCNLDLIQVPECFKSTIKPKISDLKKGMALEIKNILSGEMVKESILMTRTSESTANTCEAKESNILMAKTLEQLSYLSDERFENLKNLSSDYSKLEIKRLKTNPLLKVILESESLRKEFFSLNADDRKSFAFGPKVGDAFFEQTKNNCDHIIKRSSEAFSQISCDQDVKFKNQTVTSYEKNKDFNFSDPKLTPDVALSNIQALCKEVLTSPENAKDLTELLNSVLPENSENKTKSLTRFKLDIHSSNLATNQSLISKARVNNETNTVGAELLKFCESLTTDDSFKDLAKGSNDNINKILYSLIHDAPMDPETKVILVQEGILPDPKNEIKPTPATSVAKFDERVKNSPAKKINHVSQSSSANKNVNSESYNNMNSQNSNYATSQRSNQANGDDIASVDEQTDAEVKNLIPKSNKLSQAQKDLLKDFKSRSASASSIAKTPSAKTPVPSALSLGAGASDVSSREAAESHVPASDLGFAPNTARLSPEAAKMSERDKAIESALASRGIASTSGSAAVTVSSTKDGENLVEINVPENELLIVESFKNDLKNLLQIRDGEFALIQTGENILVKINEFEVKVVFDKNSGQYVAKCDDDKFPDAYEEVIKNYFNKILLSDRAKRSDLLKALPN